MQKLFSNPYARLAGRALAAAALAAIVSLQQSSGTIAWRAVAVGAGLAFLEVFTPLNALVGVLKPKVQPAAAP